MYKQRVGILGSTGSIGIQTLKVLERYPEKFEITLLTANSNRDLLMSQIDKHKPLRAAMQNGGNFRDKTRIYSLSALADSSFYDGVDIVLNGITGIAGLMPSFAVLKSGVKLATANKESLVAAGEYLIATSKKFGAPIIPVDSEHSALMQCIGQDKPEKLIITASGGAFRDYSLEMLKTASYTDALNHPTWKMGAKVTIDSATLMNKGFELIEAKWLFNTNNIDVLLHRESIVHAMVAFRDGNLKMCLSYPRMEIPIQYALTYPEHLDCIEHLDLEILNNLTFQRIDENKFPCLSIGKAVLKEPWRGAALTVADEIALQLFRNGRIGFTEIPQIINNILDYSTNMKHNSIEDVFAIIDAINELSKSKFKLK
ncbi:MAG: 1-deoxy-D-xylulose-5-phosphate reductoisomerase [Christensenellaceae bacterium]|jgi:1-deoxy-D-xylulose-5-phosphate reductoisomerase|nr:1-deoxy-D-xylulose-5-phosphate reductoisomerase [Christensenellaceae bacterium]